MGGKMGGSGGAQDRQPDQGQQQDQGEKQVPVSAHLAERVRRWEQGHDRGRRPQPP